MNNVKLYLCLAAFLIGSCSGSRSAKTGMMQPARPNIVLIMADDMGYGDLGCYGNPEISTPHLDSLAAGGLMLTNYHSNGVVCSPTRASLLTGLYPQEAGIEGVVTAKNHRDTGMPTGKYTMSEFLNEAGYKTALFGKWHLGYQPELGPNVQGFDRFRGFVSGNVDYQSHIDQEGFADWWDQGKRKPEEGYLTNLITDHALQFLGGVREQPFFLYLAHGAPHYPYQGSDDPAVRIAWDASGREAEPGAGTKAGGDAGEIAQSGAGSTDKPGAGRTAESRAGRIAKPGAGRTAGRPDLDRVYREMIESLDKNVGRVVSYLEENGLMENTLIIFCSDNGASPKIGSNGPFRGNKGLVYEGGHRVPAIFYWKGIIQAGTSDQLMLSMDIFPTIASLLAVEPTEGEQLSGQSMLPLLTGEGQDTPKKERIVFWRFKGQKAARKGQWKLVITDGHSALYDLSTDKKESRDIKTGFPEIYNELKEAIKNWESGLKEEIRA